MSEFEGRVALVAGGGRGVGRASCLELARRGADVALFYRNDAQAAAEVAKAVTDEGRRSLALQLDVADAEAVEKAVHQAVEAMGRLDFVVHSAGANVQWELVRNLDPAAFGDFVKNDLVGFFNVVHFTLRHMNEGGAIVAISSIAAQMCQARNVQGAAAKAGLEALVRVVAREEGQRGIRANAVAIGLTDTDQAKVAYDMWGPETTKRVLKAIPLGRAGKPEEIAGFVAFLLSDKGAYFTGKVLQMDGGQVISG